MSLIIRLAPFGKKGERKFRVVVKEKRSKRDGSYLENLGWYNKTTSGQLKNVNKERAEYWISKGARLSQTVKKILET